MDLQYQLIAGSYYLFDMREAPNPITGQRRFQLKSDQLAIAVDTYSGELRQHGSPTRIHSWAMQTRRRLRAAGHWDSAADLVVISGPFPVEEINRCLRIRGYGRRLLARLASLPHGKSAARPSQGPQRRAA